MFDGYLSLFNATVTEEKSLSWESSAFQSWAISVKCSLLSLLAHFGLYYFMVIIVPKMADYYSIEILILFGPLDYVMQLYY
jgi:hypothetical protein